MAESAFFYGKSLNFDSGGREAMAMYSLNIRWVGENFDMATFVTHRTGTLVCIK